LYNSLTALLDKNDYADYYRAEGWTAFLTYEAGEAVRLRASFADEDHSRAPITTHYSLIRHRHLFRPNPQAVGGTLHAVSLNIGLGRERVPFDLVTNNGLDILAEYSSSDIGSDFTFGRYEAIGTINVATFARRFLFPPSLRVRVAAGTSTGTLPPQRTFSLESQSSSFAPFGTMKAMEEKEFRGTSYIALNMEHNFRSLPFLALGMSFLSENAIELIVHGGVAKSWNDGPLALNTTGSLYAEAGFGISRILDLFRCDFTWRFTTPWNFRFCLEAASLL
jgi:hypothetical protein